MLPTFTFIVVILLGIALVAATRYRRERNALIVALAAKQGEYALADRHHGIDNNRRRTAAVELRKVAEDLER